jgi:hypothetical protein
LPRRPCCSSASPSPCTASGTGCGDGPDRYALSPGLLTALRSDVPKRAIVFSDMETSYRISAFAPSTSPPAPPAHVADTPANDPAGGAWRSSTTSPPASRSSSTATTRDWLVVDRSRFDVDPHWPLVYEGRALRALPSARVKVLLVTMYFPPAGGGGVQRPLKFATHLPALGIETHVLAPDDPKWLHSDPDLAPPTQAWIHRARYLGPRARGSPTSCTAAGPRPLSRQARSLSRRVLVPDENVAWNSPRSRACASCAREGIDVVLTTSPPNSVHLIGAAVKRTTACTGVADLRDSIAAHPHRRVERRPCAAKEKVSESVARLVAAPGRRDRRRIGRDRRGGAGGLRARRRRHDDPQRRRLSTTSPGSSIRRGDRFRITHTGSFFGKRDPAAVPHPTAGRVGPWRTWSRASSATFEWRTASGRSRWAWARGSELHPYMSRREALTLQRDSDRPAAASFPDAGRPRPRRPFR